MWWVLRWTLELGVGSYGVFAGFSTYVETGATAWLSVFASCRVRTYLDYRIGPQDQAVVGEARMQVGIRAGAQPYSMLPGVRILTSLDNSDAQRTSQQFRLPTFFVGWNFYGDTRKTGQRTGFILLSWNNWYVYHENDAWAGQGYDRYRTATAWFAYCPAETTCLELYLFLWTGDPTSAPIVSWQGKRWRLLTQGIAGAYTHGVTAFAIRWHQYTFQIGIDSERLRARVQNAVHALPFLRKRNVLMAPVNASGLPAFTLPARGAYPWWSATYGVWLPM